MYNIVVKTVTVIAVLIMLCACTSRGGVGIKLDTSEYSAERMTVNAEILKFSGIADKNFRDTLNAKAREDVQSWIDEFMANTSPEVNSEMEITQNIHYNDRNFVSTVSEIYTYTGGAHGATVWMSMNIDINQSRLVGLSDIFKADSGYRETINKIMLDMVDENEEEYGNLWEKPVLTDRQENDFYIEDGKLVIYYQPYELSYYARGFVEFPIPLASVAEYMEDEYKRLI